DSREEWACNMLVLNKRKVIMPDHLPRTASMLRDEAGIDVTAIPFREILKNGGGLHCSTMELQRDWA
ncbi:arginine deiminase family protein, partial [Cryobacterium sp. MLB-32]